ncbi:hypothetical protein [Deinococcus sp. NW-56]|uniref:hypothetical protein n=1 Tax=Deinococcus sp. NW-56 TaxID=2080419 RepID=UPI000CF44D36|nr:hypothetical protein [Deinococcus sp. NW-56]
MKTDPRPIPLSVVGPLTYTLPGSLDGLTVTSIEGGTVTREGAALATGSTLYGGDVLTFTPAVEGGTTTLNGEQPDQEFSGDYGDLGGKPNLAALEGRVAALEQEPSSGDGPVTAVLSGRPMHTPYVAFDDAGQVASVYLLRLTMGQTATHIALAGLRIRGTLVAGGQFGMSVENNFAALDPAPTVARAEQADGYINLYFDRPFSLRARGVLQVAFGPTASLPVGPQSFAEQWTAQLYGANEALIAGVPEVEALFTPANAAGPLDPYAMRVVRARSDDLGPGGFEIVDSGSGAPYLRYIRADGTSYKVNLVAGS